MRRYLIAIICSAAVAAAGTMFIEERRTTNNRLHFANELVQSDWNTALFAVRSKDDGMDWFYDQDNPLEADAVQRLRHIFLLVDSQGRVVQSSRLYEQSGLPLPPRNEGKLRTWEWKGTADTMRYLLCTGPIHSDNGEVYQLTVGRELD
jgi:hypothetical protein